MCSVIILMILAAASWLSASLGAAVDGDPAPGRSPGPPPRPPALSIADQEDHHQLTVDMTSDVDATDSEDDKNSPCYLYGDLIVVDSSKAPFNVSIDHNIFETNVLTMGIVYQDESEKKDPPITFKSSVTSGNTQIFDPEDDDIDISKYLKPKSIFQVEDLIDSTKESILFANLDRSQAETLVKLMDVREFEGGEFVFKEGETAEYFYVIKSGQYKAFNNDKGKIREYYIGDLISELAMLYPFRHKFSLQAITFGSVWLVKRLLFRSIKTKLLSEKRKLFESYLSKIPLLATMHTSDLLNLADSLEACSYKAGAFIYKQHTCSDGLYLIETGTVNLCVEDNVGKQVVLHTIQKGGHFGDRSMVSCSVRNVSAIAVTDVVLAFLRVGAFERLMGPCRSIASEQTVIDLFGSKSNVHNLRGF